MSVRTRLLVLALLAVTTGCGDTTGPVQAVPTPAVSADPASLVGFWKVSQRGAEAGVLQHPHMFRGASETHAERRRQFPDRAFAARQMTNHRPPRWIREGMKNSVEVGRMFNHMV